MNDTSFPQHQSTVLEFVPGDGAVLNVLGLEPAFRNRVRRPLEHVSRAPDCAAVGHEQHALPLHRTGEFLEERVDPLAHLGETLRKMVEPT